MGIMILVLTPVPYVDASASWAFRSKWQRVLVGAAGMVVEVFIASFALFLWLNVEPGVVRALAYNTILIAGISTVLFNANPLLRFDGYYMLMDYLEIPNLRPRATTYLIYLVRALSVRAAGCPASDRDDRREGLVRRILGGVVHLPAPGHLRDSDSAGPDFGDPRHHLRREHRFRLAGDANYEDRQLPLQQSAHPARAQACAADQCGCPARADFPAGGGAGAVPDHGRGRGMGARGRRGTRRRRRLHRQGGGHAGQLGQAGRRADPVP